ncbi:hypothetical protein Rhe02_63300 [Rhizocola hellebori]|uniref:Secreted protein n=1 Tax=Rhizocola hellebori TaxID=1392758 RepID=A0A8J3VJS6_9ACTN|nr:hypothetical protein [Rhizocola hellebori]GIH08263.1 hypothetical protein Rhe02_63300 [Rhizocola hellebori]
MISRSQAFGPRIAFVAAVAAALIGFTSTAAYAVYDAFHGEDEAWIIGGGVTLWVQDNECDNHGVYGEATWDNNLSYMSVHDSDGCGGNYAFANTFNGHPIQKFRVCEISKGCSAWRVV